MVVMSAERLAARRKANQNDPSSRADSSSATSAVQQASSATHILHGRAEDNPNHLVYKKMETIVQQMQDESSGVPVRTVKSFMSKVPSVFTGADLVAWILKNQDVDDHVEALHLAYQMSIHGYIFPIDDHVLSVRNDATFYRFQTPYFWPSNSWEPENTEYAVYLCKRTMQNKTRLELADYEGENLARLQKIFSRKWEFIFMQAEAQSKVDKKRDKLERKILDSQERAFWDVHRPVPGCVNTTELDIKKACRTGSRSVCVAVAADCGHLPPPPPSEPSTSPASHSQSSGTGQLQQLTDTVHAFRQRIDRCSLRLSKVAETLISYYEQYLEYDALLTTPDMCAPWITDSTEYWDLEKSGKDVPPRRVKRWAFSLSELLRDPLGCEQFVRFLDKEFSSENLRFYLALQELRTVPLSAVPERAAAIWSEFLAADATYSVNIDSRSFDITKKNMEHPDRRTFEAAGAHLFHLMKSDSYTRYLRSDMYRDFLSGAKKKVSVRGIRSIVPFAIKKDSNT